MKLASSSLESQKELKVSQTKQIHGEAPVSKWQTLNLQDMSLSSQNAQLELSFGRYNHGC